MDGLLFKYLGAAICAVVVILLLKQTKSEFTVLITLSASVIILGAAIANMRPGLRFITSTLESTAYGGYVIVLVKALGIGLAAQSVADICRDSGESAVASKVELLAKTEIMLLSLPLLEEIVKLTGEILKI